MSNSLLYVWIQYQVLYRMKWMATFVLPITIHISVAFQRLTTLQIISSHVWLLASVLDSMVPDVWRWGCLLKTDAGRWACGARGVQMDGHEKMWLWVLFRLSAGMKALVGAPTRRLLDPVPSASRSFWICSLLVHKTHWDLVLALCGPSAPPRCPFLLGTSLLGTMPSVWRAQVCTLKKWFLRCTAWL